MSELFHEFLNLFSPVRFVEYVHEEEDDRSYKCHEYPHYSYVWSDYFANPQYLVNYPLKSSHVTLLNKLMLQYAVFYLLLGKVNIIWEDF